MLQQKPASEGDFEAGWRSRCSADTDNATPLQLAHWAYNNLTAQPLPLVPADGANLGAATAASAATTSAAAASTAITATAAHRLRSGVDRCVGRIRQDDGP
jgi:hypothetical protein